jgi:hypothetical protein
MTTLNLTQRQVTILGIALTNLYDKIYKSGEGQQMRDDIMRHWMNTHNTHLGFCPADSLTDEESLAMMTEYLEHFANI